MDFCLFLKMWVNSQKLLDPAKQSATDSFKTDSKGGNQNTTQGTRN